MSDETAPHSLQGLAGESIELLILSKLSRILIEQLEVSELLTRVIKLLQEHLGFKQSALSLRSDQRLIIEASYGLSESAIARASYRIGEGITGKVVLSGQSVITPESNEFADSLKEPSLHIGKSFICVPIKHSGAIIGALSATFSQLDSDSSHKVVNLLEIVAHIIADAIDASRTLMHERQLLERENDRMRIELGENKSFANIVGHSSAMRSVYMELSKVARTNANVLLLGESGTGKELLAQAIHYSSEHSEGAFVAVNCAALPEGLIESELFGHEKGAFTGAIKQRIGRFEEAHNGTLFLDEIGDIPLHTQIKLLRVLQEKSFQRVGSQQSIQSHARIIAATSRDLLKMKEDGSFREDLYYRLAVLPIIVPPLRSRKADIISLCDHFLAKYNKHYNKEVKRITTPAIDMLMTYHWPGNVRELENMIERAVIITNDSAIKAVDLPPSLQTAAATRVPPVAPSSNAKHDSSNFDELCAAFEKELITTALKQSHGNISAAARELGTTLRKLNYRIKQLHIEASLYSGATKDHSSINMM